jgi:hydroxymethylpyrimidine pyrophosphatase-like HAD family hydrolase
LPLPAADSTTTLAKYFDAVKDDMFFVAENGSYVMHRDQELYVQSLELSIARQDGRNCPYDSQYLHYSMWQEKSLR